MSSANARTPPLPVESGIWVVVFGELSIFTLFFSVFLYYRALSPELFAASSATLDQGLGALNTVILLTSSWFVASAVTAIQQAGGRERALRYFSCALACGAAFVLVKVFEYGGALRDGVNVLTDEFFMFYFMLTGIHLMHLLVGMALLGATALQLRGSLATGNATSNTLVGFSSCFWHMLDIVWIVLFPLLYLLQ